MPSPPKLVGTLEIAAVPCALACDDPDFAAVLLDRYSGFLSRRPPALTVDIEVRHEPPVDGDPNAVYARIAADEGTITVDGDGFHGLFDEHRGSGQIVQPADPSPLEALLTAVFASRLLREGGCLLHAAAVVRDGVAHVFYGPSGSGKTTVAELFGDGVISDEIAVLRPAHAGWIVSGMPWRGTTLTAPLGSVLRLRQSRRTEFQRLAPALAIRSLLGCALFARPDGREIQAFLDTASAIISRVPSWEMAFRPDREFLTLLPRGIAA
jgi:hypothetical protein